MTENHTDIWVIGSINTDMVVRTGALPRPGETVLGGEFLMNAGGKGANQAVAAARLGARVSMVGSVGQDMFGDQAVAGLTAEAVGCRHVYKDASKASGIALISVDEHGENHIVVAPGANSTLSTNQVEEAFTHIPENSLVLLQLEIPLATVEHAFHLARQKHCRVILDPAPAQELPSSILQGLFLVTPNQSEATLLAGIEVKDLTTAETAARQLLSLGVDNVALTLGSEGVVLANQQQLEHITAPAVTAMDSTAAGDCFNGALATALARGSNLREAVKFACRAAAVAVTRMGAQDSMPRLSEIEARD